MSGPPSGAFLVGPLAMIHSNTGIEAKAGEITLTVGESGT